MKSLGISLEDGELRELRILALGDRRSISWLLRAAVKEYLTTRKDDVHRYSVQQVMEKLAEQGEPSEQQRAREKEDRLIQEVARMAAAAGIDSDPESVKAAIAASIKALAAKLDDGLKSESSEPVEQKKVEPEIKERTVAKSKEQIVQSNREQLLADAESRFKKKQTEKLETKSK